MRKFAHLALLFALSAVNAHADIVWTGAVDDDIFNEANWDLSGSTVTVIDPDVSIDDDVVISNAAAPVVFPDIPGQVRFQLADTRTMTIDNSTVLVANNDGFGGVPGTTNGPTVTLLNGAHLTSYFIVYRLTLDVTAGCTAVLGGGGAPINGGWVNLTGGTLLSFTNETVTDFVNDHLTRVTVDWAPAVVDGNITVVSDGAAGCVVNVISPVIAFCTGDQSTCPCGNENDASNGSAGCANGANSGGAALSASGSTSIASGDLVLAVQGALPGQPCLFFQGNNAIGGGTGVQFGDGLRCAGGGVIRLQVRFADGSGDAQTNLNIPAAGACAVGDTRRYQGWYRDPSLTLCGAGFNLSNGVELVWGS